MKNKFITWLLLFFGILLVFRVFGIGQPKEAEIASRLDEKPVGIMTTDTEYGMGKEVILEVQNNSDSTITFAPSCPTKAAKNPISCICGNTGSDLLSVAWAFSTTSGATPKRHLSRGCLSNHRKNLAKLNDLPLEKHPLSAAQVSPPCSLFLILGEDINPTRG